MITNTLTVHFLTLIKSKKLLLLTFLISLVLSVLIIYLLPSHEGKYHLEILNTTLNTKNKQYIYSIYLEDSLHIYQIQAIYNIVDEADILIYNDKHLIVNDIPLWGHFIKYGARLFFYDTNHNNSKEIYAFTIYHDSLWLHIIYNFRVRPVDVKHVFVSRVNQSNSFEDYQLSKGLFVDFDKDHIDDFIFSVGGSYSLQPRKIFLYKPDSDTLYSSPDFANYPNNFVVGPNSGDGFPDVFLDTSAPFNFDTLHPVPYMDNCAWLMVLDHNLHFLFPPVPKKGYTSFYKTLPFHSGTRSVIVTLNGSRNEFDSTYHLSLLDYAGKTIRQKVFFRTEDMPTSLFLLNTYPNNFFLLLQSNRIAECDSMLHLKTVSGPYPGLQGPIFISDLDGDGKKEIMFISSKNNSLLVFNQKLQKLAAVTLSPIYYNYAPYLNTYRDKNGQPVFRLGWGYTNFLMKFSHNPFYFLIYFIYAGIFAIIFISLLLLLKLQHNISVARYEREKRFTQLQLKTLKNQMDPHFTFNAITSLGTLIYMGDKETAYDYLVRFSNLIRTTVESSDKVARSLKEELEFTKNYLELQKFRFKEKLEYKINIEEGVDPETKVPRMVIQSHVENALKHGLMHAEHKGLLQINGSHTADTLILEIIDNGIGREKARELNKHSTKKGLKITDQYYTLINKFNKTKIRQEIIDLYDKNGIPAGTKVIIYIPNNTRYNF